ncbi:MAG: 2-oxoglutarate dehydrogenase E2 component, partial [Chitinophagaceae bacterium]
MIEIKVPTVGESINEVTLLKWTKKEGEWVERDEVIAELESEKATFEVNAEKAGILIIVGKEGDTLNIGDVLGKIDTDAAKPAAAEAPVSTKEKEVAKPVANEAPVTVVSNDIKATPVASAIIADKKVDAKLITPSGTGGKIMKQDVLEAIANPGKKPFAGETALFGRN